jgi:hypothetical protein
MIHRQRKAADQLITRKSGNSRAESGVMRRAIDLDARHRYSARRCLGEGGDIDIRLCELRDVAAPSAQGSLMARSSSGHRRRRGTVRRRTPRLRQRGVRASCGRSCSRVEPDERPSLQRHVIRASSPGARIRRRAQSGRRRASVRGTSASLLRSACQRPCDAAAAPRESCERLGLTEAPAAGSGRPPSTNRRHRPA